MSFTRFLAVAKKEVVQILRDSRSLIIVLIMPVILVLLFGYGVNLDLKGLPVYVYDRDGSQQSQDLLKRFQASEYFNVVRVVNDYPALTRSLDDGHAKMGIVVPWDFSQRLHDGRSAQIQALVDGSDDNTANILIGYAQAVVQSYSSDIQLQWLRDRGQVVQPAPVSVETRTWYNEDLESSAFIVPGVLALVMSVIGAFLTSLTIAREWERGTMEQLISTPVTPLEIMLWQAGALFHYRYVRCDRLCPDCYLLVPGSLSRLLSNSACQFCVVYGGGAFAWILHLRDRGKSVGGQSDGPANYLPSRFPAVWVSVFD